MQTIRQKHIPMIFSSDMIIALAGGNKISHRLPISKNVQYSPNAGFSFEDKHGTRWMCGVGSDYEGTKRNFIKGNCPYEVGDLIWVRETFNLRENPYHDLSGMYLIEYDADDGCKTINPSDMYDNNDHLAYASIRNGLTPSIQMPRYASRMTLRVTNVDIHLLNDITDDDAIKEGMPTQEQALEMASNAGLAWYQKPKKWFEFAWNKRHKNWDKNPYVCVIEFDVIKKNIDDMVATTTGAKTCL